MGRIDPQYGKGGRGTKIWGERIEQAVEEGRRAKKELESLGYKFEPYGGGLLAYKVTCPDDTIIKEPIGVNGLLDILEKRRRH